MDSMQFEQVQEEQGTEAALQAYVGVLCASILREAGAIEVKITFPVEEEEEDDDLPTFTMNPDGSWN